MFNSFEKYDYIGNTNLKNEVSLEGNAFIGFKKPTFSAKLSSSYFHISNYIVGKPLSGLVPMTIGANGVKQYEALDFATILNVILETEVQLLDELKWRTQLGYNRGKDFENVNLPFMSPFSYQTSLSYLKDRFSADVAVIGNTKHKDFSPVYGETKTPDYVILNAGLGYNFVFGKNKIYTKIGAENVLDRFYTTYSDWNKIPRPGRNFYVNVNYSF